MTATLLGLYLKLNLLLAATYLLWLLTKRVAHLLGLEISHARQLTVARFLFLGILLAIPFALLANVLIPGWLAGFAQPLFLDEFRVVANLDNTLARPYPLGGMTLVPAFLLATVLLAGLLIQLARLARQVQKLRTIIAGATESKCLSGIHLLFSAMISTPFSTRALGKMHIVLPYQLLDSPRNLRLAVKHELQHMRNHDLEWVIVLEAASVVFFWNPAMWLWHNEFDCLQEFACDEVLVNERHVGAQAYGSCLLEVASASTGGALIASSNMVPKFSLWSDNRSQLKRRILMLAKVSNTQHATLKSLGYALLAGIGLMNTALVVFAADAGDRNAEPVGDARPLVRINPDYPEQALAETLEAWVQLEFTIDEAGNVINPTVVDHCVTPQGGPAGDCKAPSDLFDESALAAVARWKYQPNAENGVAVKRENVQTIIRFMLEDDAEEQQAPAP